MQRYWNEVQATVIIQIQKKERRLKNIIFQSRDLCLRALDTNSPCAKSVRRNEEKEWLDLNVM